MRPYVDEIVTFPLVNKTAQTCACPEVGIKKPAPWDEVGKAMLAFLPEAAFEQAITRQSFHPYTLRTLDTPDKLRAELRVIRKRGHAFDDEEHEPGIICCAAPILTSTGRVIGALSVTYNIPFAQVASASLDLKPSGTGTIALKTKGETRLAYLQLWPHARPWHLKETEPALRCISGAEAVARILAEAAEARVSLPVVKRADADPALSGAVAAE